MKNKSEWSDGEGWRENGKEVMEKDGERTK